MDLRPRHVSLAKNITVREVNTSDPSFVRLADNYKEPLRITHTDKRGIFWGNPKKSSFPSLRHNYTQSTHSEMYKTPIEDRINSNMSYKFGKLKHNYEFSGNTSPNFPSPNFIEFDTPRFVNAIQDISLDPNIQHELIDLYIIDSVLNIVYETEDNIIDSDDIKQKIMYVYKNALTFLSLFNIESDDISTIERMTSNIIAFIKTKLRKNIFNKTKYTFKDPYSNVLDNTTGGSRKRTYSRRYSRGYSKRYPRTYSRTYPRTYPRTYKNKRI